MSATPEPTAHIDPRWASSGYTLFAAALLVFALVQLPAALGWFSPTLGLLLLLLLAPFHGFLLAPRSRWQRIAALVLVVVVVLLVLSTIMLSGGYASPFWVALFMPVLAVLLLMPGPAGTGAAAAIWCGYGMLVILMPGEQWIDAAATWLLQTAVVGLVGLVLARLIKEQQALRQRSLSREQALQDFLQVSNRLRVSTQAQRVLEDVAGAVQSAGDFDCVTLSLVDWRRGVAQVAVAIGASGRRLSTLEQLEFPWNDFSQHLDTPTIGVRANVSDRLPFRSIPGEQHVLLPMVSQLDEIRGVLTVSAARPRRVVLFEALPLLELLANQAAAALDNTDLYVTLEQRVQESTADLARKTDEVRRARDNAEVLFEIAQSLSVTLDERQVLEQTLALVARTTGAQRGGIMLVEPTTGRLVFRTTLEREHGQVGHGLERGQGLAGWVLANRTVAIVADTTKDARWQLRSDDDGSTRAALAAPIMLESEALGVLILIHAEPLHFSDDHATVALAAAGQAAAALSKAHLYRYVSEQSERLGVIAHQREEEATKLLAILRSIGDGVVVGDRLGRVRIINPAATDILGITDEVFTGRALVELPGVPEDFSTTAANRMQKFTIGERTVRAHIATVVSSHEEWLGSVVVYHDITHEELTDRLKNELVATASHELRTPLTSIRGYVDMLLLGTFGAVSDQQRAPLHVIKANVARLSHLVSELLDMSKIEAGEVRLHRDEVDVCDILRAATDELYAQFNERNITLELELQMDLPLIIADRQRLQQIVVNLVSNACKYTPRGGSVLVALSNGSDELRVDVRDTGVGISQDAAPHIFTPFYRADNPLRDEVGGTGLGLSITRKLVELHGGQIWFESVENQGSTFSFTLPLVCPLNDDIQVGVL